jgi:hypothetical protein
MELSALAAVAPAGFSPGFSEEDSGKITASFALPKE